jgi:hypothetical protein
MALVLAGCFDSGGDETSPDAPPSPANTPPTANAGSDQVVPPGVAVNLNGAGSSDANGTIATYAWTQTAGSAITLTSSGTATPSFTAPSDPGTLTFQLTVTDNGGASHSDSVSVTVNAIPVANAGADQAVSAGAAVSLMGTATDADGSISSYSWTQTSGPQVTLNGANGAAASFTAPILAAILTFDLTATDDRGATHVDSVTVTVSAIVVNPPLPQEPAIARHPNHPIVLEHGSAMMFVAASGEDLTYEWHSAGGAVVKSGPEPFLMLTNLFTSDDDDCYYVVVSNDHGTATSEQGCLTVEDIDWKLDRSDDDETDDAGYALGYGAALLHITQWITGPLTGTAFGMLGFPQEFGPAENCYAGSYGGTLIDGVMVTTNDLPLGHHTLSEAWNDCFSDADDTDPRNGGYLVEYDFPQQWGVGTVTLHVSEPYFNGTLQATVTSTGTGGARADQIEITNPEDFSNGDLNAPGEESISVERRYRSDGIVVDEAFVTFHVLLRAFDRDGTAGLIGIRQGNFFHLRQHFDDGDNGEPEFTSTDTMLVESGGYALALLEPNGTNRGWNFHVIPPEECPADTCADLPEP